MTHRRLSSATPPHHHRPLPPHLEALLAILTRLHDGYYGRPVTLESAEAICIVRAVEELLGRRIDALFFNAITGAPEEP